MANNGDNPATKADISLLKAELATKTELREGITLLDKKIDILDKKIDRVAVALVNTQADVREIRHDMATKTATKDDINRVLKAIDSFAKKAESYDRAAVLHGHALVEVQVNLKNHEKRLKTLESTRP